MARTKHKIVQKAAVGALAFKAGKRKGAKNSDLKQAAHQGRAPVKDPRNAQPGFAAVPASTATLPPGQGPPMSSTPTPAGRGRNSKARASKSRGKATGPIRGFSGNAGGVGVPRQIQPSASPAGGASQARASRRGRGKRKR